MRSCTISLLLPFLETWAPCTSPNPPSHLHPHSPPQPPHQYSLSHTCIFWNASLILEILKICLVLIITFFPLFFTWLNSYHLLCFSFDVVFLKTFPCTPTLCLTMCPHSCWDVSSVTALGAPLGPSVYCLTRT